MDTGLFSDEMLGCIAAALPRETPPERAAVLPEILRAWSRNDLQSHLKREKRAVFKQRQKRFSDLRQKARDLLQLLLSLDRDQLYEIDIRVQFHTEVKDGSPRLAALGLPDDPAAGEARRHETVDWLLDLLEALGEPSTKPPPDVKTRNGLIVLDLAAIFELVTRTRATRSISSDTSKPNGPFWEFALPVWMAIFRSESGLQSAIRNWADDFNWQEKRLEDRLSAAECALGRPLQRRQDNVIIETIARSVRSGSSFIANLQSKHPNLWQKIEGPGQ